MELIDAFIYTQLRESGNIIQDGLWAFRQYWLEKKSHCMDCGRLFMRTVCHSICGNLPRRGKKSYLNHRYRLSHLFRTVFTARWTERKRRAVSWSGESEFEMRFTHPAHNKLTGRESPAGDQDTVPNQHQAERSHGWWRLNQRKAAVVTICA